MSVQGVMKTSCVGFKKQIEVEMGDGLYKVLYVFLLFCWLTTMCMHSGVSSCISCCYLLCWGTVVHCLCRLHICVRLQLCGDFNGKNLVIKV